MTLDQLVAALNARKNTGAWHGIAERAGVSYDTVARIARGAISNPGARTVERLVVAVRALPERV